MRYLVLALTILMVGCDSATSVEPEDTFKITDVNGTYVLPPGWQSTTDVQGDQHPFEVRITLKVEVSEDGTIKAWEREEFRGVPPAYAEGRSEWGYDYEGKYYPAREWVAPSFSMREVSPLEDRLFFKDLPPFRCDIPLGEWDNGFLLLDCDRPGLSNLYFPIDKRE